MRHQRELPEINSNVIFVSSVYPGTMLKERKINFRSTEEELGVSNLLELNQHLKRIFR